MDRMDREMREPDEEPVDPYAPTPAVMGDEAPPAKPDEGARPIAPGFEYPETWGVPALGEVIPTAFRLWRATLGRTINLGLIAVVGTALSLIVDCFAAVDPAIEQGAVSAIGLGFQLLIGMPLSILCSTTACFVAADQLAFGRQRLSLLALFRRSLGFFWSYLGASFLMGLALAACFVPGAVLWALGFDPFSERPNPLAIAGFAACGLFAVRIFARWSVFGEAIFFEGRSLKSSLDRSRELVIGSTWPVLGLVLLQQLVTGAAETAWPYLAPYIGPIPAAILAIAGSVLALGFAAVWSFTVYAALRDRELARAGTED